MKKIMVFKRLAFVILMGFLFFLPPVSNAQERFQIELYGGISFVSPKDFNLLSKAEERYNEIYFIDRLRSYDGYFVNDFPEIKQAIPGGIRFRYHVSEKLSFSLAAEGLFHERKRTIEGSFSYSTTVSENHTKRYDPFQISLSGYAVLGGIHYRLPVGNRTEVEVGAAAGWTRARFDFRSNWSYRAVYNGTSVSYDSIDGGTLEGDGSGTGVMAQGMLRLNRMLGKRIGFFVETAYTFCRMKSFEGNGKETRIFTPGEKTWEGTWGIKKEEIHVPWKEEQVLVATNYWGGWTASQRERDFVLDLSGFRLVLGICFRL
jgi:hypothetical protein